jgi:hypothetical protein
MEVRVRDFRDLTEVRARNSRKFHGSAGAQILKVRATLLIVHIEQHSHETACVSAGSGLAWISSLCDSWVIYLLKRISALSGTFERAVTHSCRILLSVVNN